LEITERFMMNTWLTMMIHMLIISVPVGNIG